MNLGSFINDNMESILHEWLEYAISIDNSENLNEKSYVIMPKLCYRQLLKI